MGKSSRTGKKHKKSKLEKLQASYRIRYFSWNNVDCPSLGTKVHFTRLGWNHITKNSRPSIEIENRLKLLPLVKKMIEESSATPTRHSRYRDGKWKTYHKITDILDNTRVVAVFLKSNLRFLEGYIFVSDFEDEDLP